jgi:small GTP-binding protein
MMYDFLYKAMIIGDSGVGKSTLFSRLTNTSHDDSPTIGIEFGTTLTAIPDGTTIKVNIWDTAGQEFYHAIVKNYYRDIVGAIFVFDISNADSFKNIKNVWMEEFKKYNQHFVKNLLIGNKSDLIRCVDFYEAKQFAEQNDMDYVEISSLNNNNIYYFDSYIEQIYQAMPLEIEIGMGILKNNIPREEVPKCCIIN